MRKSKKTLILTCEHGGAEIPKAYKKLFRGHSRVLKTHRGLDIGALPIAKNLRRILKVYLQYSEISRLVVDLNRRLDNPTLFSEFISPLNDSERKKILDKYYYPHWNKISTKVLKTAFKNQVIHVAVHSMTDQLDDQHRHMQLALLYDPRRKSEKYFAKLWIQELRKEFPGFKITRNNPYQGAKGGLTGYFRELLSESEYLGIEIEMNQAYLLSLDKRQRQKFSKTLASTLQKTLNHF